MRRGKFTPIYRTNIYEESSPVAFHQDNHRFYFFTNKGDLDLKQLMLMDPTTMKTELVEADPLKRVDFGELKMSEVTHEPISPPMMMTGCVGFGQDKTYEEDFKLIQQHQPGADLFPISSTKDERFWLVSAIKDIDPGITICSTARPRR
jgi:hypothetical protein